MSDTFGKIISSAFDKSRGIADRIYRRESGKMDKDINIESYDEKDAFYTGTDEEYEEFLKNADIQMNGEPAEPVENTQKINLNETINLQSVIDKFKKTAGGIKDTVVSKVDELKSKKETSPVMQKAEEIKEDVREAIDESGIKEKVRSAASKIDDFRENVTHSGRVEEQLGDVSAAVGEIARRLIDVSDKLNEIEAQGGQRGKDSESSLRDMRSEIRVISDNVAEIKQTVGAVSKLNDSVFDLKNAQLNTKNALSDMETGVSRLKRKCILGVTVLSILSAIVIVLEIILMLS